ncbi:MAG TPA: aminotransferase class V-fold PLP-dependent enzyme [Candidatus Limnocylindria bacterium]|nr:aminotransferase class V-fold PLP-dependent enzyme [Candidatus Limnocylindria bacterium]
MFPEKPQHPTAILEALAAARARDVRYEDGRLFALVYGVSEEHARLLADAYGAYLATNGLGAGLVFPSLAKLEADVIGDTLELLGNPEGAGSFTSGGTESIIMALRAAKETRRAAGTLPAEPEVVVPASAHPAFEKACALMEMRCVRTPLAADYTADVAAFTSALSPRTVAAAASAPCYPFGVVDDVPALAAAAAERGVHFHTDACVGGFALPWLEQAGHVRVPAWDFRVPGVCTMSADLHKYGFAARGTSLVLYRDAALKRAASFRLGTWVGGPYATPTLAGSRPGGAVAAAWAATRYFGREGYTRLHVGLLELTARYMAGVRAAGCRILGAPPMSVFAFTPDDPAVDPNAVADRLLEREWALLRQPTTPPSLHLLLTPRHEPACERFVADLADAVAAVRASGARSTTTADYTR